MSDAAVRLVTEGVFTVNPPSLLGAHCDECGASHFPRLAQCPYCGADGSRPVELADHGTLWGWTAVTAAPPGSIGEVPYGFGVVELPDGLRVVTRLALPEDSWEFGQPMHLRIAELGPDADGVTVLTWEFAP